MAYIGGNLAYTDERPAGFSNRFANGEVRTAESYTTVNLRAGYTTGRWSLELYGKNLTDELGVTTIDSVNTPATGIVELGVIRPRTYGLMLGVNF